jgi:hypothetical protein
MKHALFSDLEQSSFIPGEMGLGTNRQCIKVFGTEEEAIAHAAELIRNHVVYDADDPSEAVTDEEVLEEFQSCLEGMEYFHIYPVVE